MKKYAYVGAGAGHCPIFALRRAGYIAHIKKEGGVDVLVTNAPAAVLSVCAGHGGAYVLI